MICACGLTLLTRVTIPRTVTKWPMDTPFTSRTDWALTLLRGTKFTELSYEENRNQTWHYVDMAIKNSRTIDESNPGEIRFLWYHEQRHVAVVDTWSHLTDHCYHLAMMRDALVCGGFTVSTTWTHTAWWFTGKTLSIASSNSFKYRYVLFSMFETRSSLGSNWAQFRTMVFTLNHVADIWTLHALMTHCCDIIQLDRNSITGPIWDILLQVEIWAAHQLNVEEHGHSNKTLPVYRYISLPCLEMKHQENSLDLRHSR